MTVFDDLQGTINNAPEVAQYPNINIGRVTGKVNLVRWVPIGDGSVDDKGRPKNKAEKTPWPAGYVLNKEAGEKMELSITMDVKEWNPALEFDWERNINIEKSSADGRTLTDWTEIVEKSLIATFGPVWVEKLLSGQMYVKVEDVANVNGKKSGKGTVFSVPKFLEVYANRDAAKAARDLMFVKSGGAAEVADAIPAAVIESARKLIASVGGNVSVAKTALASKPFGDYDADVLVALASQPVAA